MALILIALIPTFTSPTPSPSLFFTSAWEKPARIEETVTMEDVSYKALLPCVQCSVNDLPDSDGQLTDVIIDGSVEVCRGGGVSQVFHWQAFQFST